jgi:hypothetical protein
MIAAISRSRPLKASILSATPALASANEIARARAGVAQQAIGRRLEAVVDRVERAQSRRQVRHLKTPGPARTASAYFRGRNGNQSHGEQGRLDDEASAA